MPVATTEGFFVNLRICHVYWHVANCHKAFHWLYYRRSRQSAQLECHWKVGRFVTMWDILCLLFLNILHHIAWFWRLLFSILNPQLRSACRIICWRA